MIILEIKLDLHRRANRGSCWLRGVVCFTLCLYHWGGKDLVVAIWWIYDLVAPPGPPAVYGGRQVTTVLSDTNCWN